MKFIKSKMLFIFAVLLFSSFVAYSQSWEGVWSLKNKNTLTITKATNNSFYFEFSSENGTEKGNLAGKAMINGNTADFINEEQCPIKFTLQGKIITVKVLKYKGDDYSSYDADRCKLLYGDYYEGKYLGNSTKSQVLNNTTDKDLTQKIANIKTLYKDLKTKEKSLKKTTKTIADEYGMEATYDIYKYNNEVKIVKKSTPGDDCGEVREIYFDNNKPFFVLYTRECWVNEASDKDENRYYIDNFKLIQYLEGKKKTNIKSNNPSFKDAQTEIENLMNDLKTNRIL